MRQSFFFWSTISKMASLQRLSQAVARTVIRRQFSVTVASRTTALVPEFDPAPVNRPTLGKELESLTTKERGPWHDLTREEKIELYRAQFPQTLEESNYQEPQGAKVAGGVFIGTAIAILWFLFLKKYVGPEPPRTINEEWVKKTQEKMKLYRMNPITGISSEK